MRLFIVDDAPTVEPKKGEWERKYGVLEPGVFAYYDLAVCPFCGDKHDVEYADIYKFCPNCGAVMREDKYGGAEDN